MAPPTPLQQKLKEISAARLSPDLGERMRTTIRAAGIRIDDSVYEADLSSADDTIGTARQVLAELADGTRVPGTMPQGLVMAKNYLVHLLCQNKNYAAENGAPENGEAFDKAWEAYSSRVDKLTADLLFRHEFLPPEDMGLPDPSYAKSAKLVIAIQALTPLCYLPNFGSYSFAARYPYPPDLPPGQDADLRAAFNNAPQIIAWVKDEVLTPEKASCAARAAALEPGEEKSRLTAEGAFIDTMSAALDIAADHYLRAKRDLNSVRGR